jgi:purine nucleosidase
VTIQVHLDTDIGGDTDDLCALAMLLGWPGADLVGVTTSSEEKGARAGLASYVLRLAGRGDVPVVAGADGSLGGYRTRHDLQDLGRYWPGTVEPEPSRPGAALDLLAKNAEAGATIVAIGPWTNLALLEAVRPGLLGSTRVVVMGGYVRPPRPGFPSWGPEVDYNVQQDAMAARVVWERCAPVLVQLSVCLEARLRGAHLARLRGGGELARLVARQGEQQGTDQDMGRMGREHPELPDDLLNFHYDPLACAVAAGWDGARVEDLELRTREEDGVLDFPEEPGGFKTRVVTGIDGPRFEEDWLRAVVPVRPGD